MKHWESWGRYVLSAAMSALIGWFAFIAHRPVPVLDWFDLGIHEAGHMVTMMFPDLVMFLAGSVAQVLFPLGMAAYFGWRRRDAASGGFCLAWAGTSAWDVSVYIADAPVQALPLVGGGTHDWAWILGRFDAIDRAGSIAGFTESIGALMLIAGIGTAIVAMAGKWRRAPLEDPPRPEPVPIDHRSRALDPAGDPWLAAANAPFLDSTDETPAEPGRH
jgi:hypothetical protein